MDIDFNEIYSSVINKMNNSIRSENDDFFNSIEERIIRVATEAAVNVISEYHQRIQASSQDTFSS
jgi:hypothetical protein